MGFDKKYELFRKDYFKNASELVEGIFKKFPKISSILLDPSSPLSKKEWLKRELAEAIENEDYEYCVKIQKEIQKL